MNNKERAYHMAHEALIILAVIALLSFICRLWPIIILALIGLIAAALRLLFLKARKEEPAVHPVVEETPKEPELKDVYDLAYSLILKRISELVASEYEGAKWVWETQNAKKKIENGEEVRIVLNGAGGYRRANVCITALRVVGLTFETTSEETPENNEDESDAEEETEDEEEKEEPQINYGLIAYEWVEAHIMELNTRLNEAIGEKREYLLLTPEELPTKDSWDKVREELIRSELDDVECVDEGIKINIRRETQKGNETHEHMDE